MRYITEILRLKHEAKLSHEKIARALGVSKGVVSKYVSLAQAKGVAWPLPEAMDEAALERLLFPAPSVPARFVEPDLPRIHHELKRKGVTLQLLWAEYVATHGEAAYRYSQFCHRYRLWQGQQRRSMRQVHRAGEKLFLDYCGPTVPVVDPTTGELREAQVFVAVLGASSYTYAEATWTQALPDWIASHQRALRYFGGTPELWVPDNLRSAVRQPCRYAPEPNATYAELARHYGAAILPARRAHRQWSPGRFMNWARDIGVATLQVVEHQLKNRPHPEHGYRACLGLLNLAKRYSRSRLEAACARALAIHSPTYRSVSSILDKGLDRQPHEAPGETAAALPAHGNVRGPGYYN